MKHKRDRIIQKEKLIEEIEEWANELLHYDAEDKIDDFNVYEWNENPEFKIIRVMSPVGQELYFKVEPLNPFRYWVTLLLDTWEKEPKSRKRRGRR